MEEGTNIYDTDAYKNSKRIFLGDLRNLCVRSLRIQDFFSEIRKQKEAAKEDTRAKTISAIIEKKHKEFNEDKDDIGKYIKKIAALLEKENLLYDAWGSDIEWIKTDFNYLIEHSKIVDQANFDIEELIDEVNEMDEKLGDIIFRASWITIPPRTNEHLEQTQIGHSIDFNDVFKDELKKEDDRKRILEHLAKTSGRIYGIVDVENGLIIRISKTIRERRKGLEHVIGLIILPLILLVGGILLNPLFTRIGLPINPSQIQTLLISYIALIIGAISHIGFQSLKQYRQDKKLQFQVLDDIILWVHVKEMVLLLEVLTIIVVFILAAHFVENITPGTAFLFGYSYDSFFDVFALRFESAVSNNTEALMKSSKEKKN